MVWPTLELDILSNEQNETEGHDLHQKKLIAKQTLEKKNKVDDVINIENDQFFQIQEKLLAVQH